MSDPFVQFAGETAWKAVFPAESEGGKDRKILSDEDNILFVEGEKRILFTKKEWLLMMEIVQSNYPLHLKGLQEETKGAKGKRK